MKKIIVPTDFSDEAQNATLYAAKFARATGCTITLLNIQSFFHLTDFTLLNRRLEAEAEQLHRTFGVSCDYALQRSDQAISNAISSDAREYDLVVMGVSQGGDALRSLFGSKGFGVAQRLEIPVLLIPGNAEFNEDAPIVVAYDYIRNGLLPLTQVVDFSKTTRNKIVVLDITETAQSEKRNEDQLRIQEIISDSYSGAAPLEFDTLHSSKITEAIDEYMTKHKGSILALCRRKRNWFNKIFHGRLLKHISFTCTYPTLIYNT